MRKTSKISFIAGSVLTALLISTTSAFAVVSSNSTETKSTTATAKASSVSNRLQGDKLKQCLARETKIDNAVSRIRDRGQKQLDLFTTIATRTEVFYTRNGKTLSNYSALVSVVNTQKVVSQQAVTALKSQKLSFSCNGTDPKAVGTAFKSALQTQNQALKDYRTAVKNLIVGVKSVTGTTTKTGSTN